MTNHEINEAVAKKLGWKELGPIKNPRTFETRPNLEGIIPDYKRQQFMKANPKGGISETYAEVIPDYVESIQAAWEIVDYLRNKGWRVIITVEGLNHACTIGIWLHEELADTAPLAICLAFLKLPDEKGV